MPLWKPAPVGVEPEIVLLRWTVREIDAGSRHFVGARADDFSGRVSSAIVNFDSATMIGITRTGRAYRLEGPPGVNQDAEYVWSSWCTTNSVLTYVDVSIDATGYKPESSEGPLIRDPSDSDPQLTP